MFSPALLLVFYFNWSFCYRPNYTKRQKNIKFYLPKVVCEVSRKTHLEIYKKKGGMYLSIFNVTLNRTGKLVTLLKKCTQHTSIYLVYFKKLKLSEMVYEKTHYKAFIWIP